MSKILSICIPTLNRAKSLANLLENIQKEIVGIEDKIEICISDNDSADETESVCQKYGEVLPIKYAKTQKLVPYDENLKNSLELATGEFAWFCGDDDEFSPESIKKTINVIEEPISEDTHSIYIPASGNQTNEGAKIYRIGSRTAYAPLFVGFIGCVCVRTELAKEIVRNKKKDILEWFMHTYIFCECAQIGKSFSYANYPGVIFRADGLSMSYAKMMHRYLISSEHSWDLKSNYPWLKVRTTITDFRTHIVRSAILVEQPELEKIAKIDFELLLKIADSEWQRAILRAFEILRKTPPFSWTIVAMYKLHRRLKPDDGGEGLVKREEGDKFWTEVRQTIERIERKKHLDKRI